VQKHHSGGADRVYQVACGTEHTLNLTKDGEVYSTGSGQYCNTGHGGSKVADNLSLIKSLADKKVVQIATGESHSLSLTDRGFLYSWGRGFEGQLGLSETIEVASVPKYVQFFHGKMIKYVATGSFHSLAITQDGDLYTWGEARSGALGTGKHRDVRKPCKVEIEGWPDVKFEQCAAGYGHSAAITSEGLLFTWGFNVYGQAGHPEKKTEWFPREVTHDIDGNEL